MADDRPEEEMENTPETSKAESAESEYGVGHILSKDEKAMEKPSTYHYSEDELEHKEDRID